MGCSRAGVYRRTLGVVACTFWIRLLAADAFSLTLRRCTPGPGLSGSSLWGRSGQCLRANLAVSNLPVLCKSLGAVGCCCLRGEPGERQSPAAANGLSVIASLGAIPRSREHKADRVADVGVLQIVPRGALLHQESTTATGCVPHRSSPVERHSDIRFVLDVPLPVELDMRSHTCWQCRNALGP